MKLTDISVVIPTFGREDVLIQTIKHLLHQSFPAGEIILVDQTENHEARTKELLEQFVKDGEIRWVRLPVPSIPHAMNIGLQKARSHLVLFLDDDIIPHENLVARHRLAFQECADNTIWCVAGQVLGRDEDVISNNDWKGRNFPFNSDTRMLIQDVMATNLCVDRQRAIGIGGFDENFLGAAYRFESEFAFRVIKNGGEILFEPTASIRHLRSDGGGTRAYGSHLTSLSPMHGVGDYYFALRRGFSFRTLQHFLRRPFQEVCTQFHLRNPWWIPVKFLGEISAMIWAVFLYARGPRYIRQD